MTPQIFPGLKPPTSKLFFDLQAMIAKNGGRRRLAEKLEAEIVKEPFKKPNYTAIRGNRWTDGEIEFILSTYHLLTSFEISTKINRREHAIEAKLCRLRRDGLLTFRKRK